MGDGREPLPHKCESSRASESKLPAVERTNEKISRSLSWTTETRVCKSPESRRGIRDKKTPGSSTIIWFSDPSSPRESVTCLDRPSGISRDGSLSSVQIRSFSYCLPRHSIFDQWIFWLIFLPLISSTSLGAKQQWTILPLHKKWWQAAQQWSHAEKNRNVSKKIEAKEKGKEKGMPMPPDRKIEEGRKRG